MAEQDMKSSTEDEHSAVNAAVDEGVHVERENGDRAEEHEVDKSLPTHSSRTRAEDDDGKEGRDGKRSRSSSDRRRHHHRHHSSSHRDHRRRRSGGHSDADGDLQETEEDNRGRRRSESAAESDNAPADKAGHSSPRKHDRRSSRNSGHSHGHSHQRSRHSLEESSDNGELSDSHEDPLPFPRDPVKSGKRSSMREKKDSHRVPVGALPERGEAEDGEILEDGELDDDEEEVGGITVRGEEAHRDEAEAQGSPSKSHSREDKHERKKSEHKEKRKRDSDEKRKRKKHADVEEPEAESAPAPAWGSGYQGPKPKVSPYRNKPQRFGPGSKRYQSPPGLYDSPSYSEDSDDEGACKVLITEGYIDASVAADEKEGLFNHKVSLGKKKKRERLYEKPDRKRPRMMDGKPDGPPRKKPLVDLAMSERPVCKFYVEGKCAKGSGCQFNHDVEKPRKMEVCKYHLTVKGCHKERCQYMHDFPCKYYHTGAKCYSGDRCKFSHDPLTEGTRRALEMRVAAEDIVDMEDPYYHYEDTRPRDFESRTRPSLLGSPPRFRPEMKKIPSLFEIEVRPPGQSPKPSPQAVRPSGFYNETNASPKPGMGPPASSGAPMNSPNMGMINNNGPMNQNNQQGFANNQQGNMGGGPGLLQPPVRSGSVMGGPMGGNRPNMMGNQQGMNPQQQRPGGGPPIQFMGPSQQQQQQGGNLPPVLNMLGAIIREAAMHKGPGSGPNNNMNMGPNNNMGPGAMGPRPNMGPNMNNMGPNIRPGNMGNMGPSGNMAPNNMGGMGPNNMAANNMGNMPANTMNNMGPVNMGQNMMGPNNNMNMGNMGPNTMGVNKMGMNNNMGPQNVNNMGPQNVNNMGPQNVNNMGPSANIGPGNDVNNLGPNNGMNNMGPNNVGMMGNNRNPAVGQPNLGQEVGIMDVDYRVKRDFEEMEEANQDITELDKLRRQLKEQIDKEDAEGAEDEHDDATGEANDEMQLQITEQKLGSDRSESSVERDDSGDGKATTKGNVPAELDQIEVPAHLPKKQRELFMRIQQQHILREKEKEKLEAQKAAEEAEAKAEVDDWYSSDEDGEGEAKPKLTDVLKKLNQESTASAAPAKENQPSVPSFALGALGSTASVTSSTASTFDIMQMINAIKKQTTPATGTSSTKAAGASSSQTSTKLSPSTLDQFSPASPPLSTSSIKKADGEHPSMHLPTLTVDPPVVSAKPLKPLVYNIVKISLPSAKPYTQLPNDVNASDPHFRHDPRVKWHLQYLEKQIQKEQQRRSSTEADKSPKTSDPRLKKAPVDPRLTAKGGDSPGSGRGDGSKPADPRLQRAQAQQRPTDPRLARQTAGNLDPRQAGGNLDPRQAGGNMDPRLNRQNSQNSQDGSNFMGGPMNSMGGGPMNSMMGNHMGGPMGNQMGGPMNNQMGGPMNSQMGGPVNSQMGGPMNNQMGGPMNNQMGGPMNNNQMGGPMNPMGGPMGGPMNSMGSMGNMGGPMGNQMGGSMNPMGGRPMQVSGSIGNNMNMMGGAPMNQMGQLRNPMGPGPNCMNRMGGPQGPGMGGPGPNMLGGGMGPRGPGVQQSPSGNDQGMFDPQMKSGPVDPRLGGPRPNDPRSAADPRFRNKVGDPREQKLNPKDPRASRRDPQTIAMGSPNSEGSNDPRTYGGTIDPGPFQNTRLQDDFQQSPSSVQSDQPSFGGQGQYKMPQKGGEWMQDTDLRLENEGLPPISLTSTTPLAMQEPDTTTSKPAPKFDHRNDPRFKRVKRFTGQRKSSMDYSSPLGGEEGQVGSDDGGDSGYNNYNRPKMTSRDPRNRNIAPSPTLPDTLQDFDTPDLTPPTEPEPDLKVKDLFKTIDPTASPFC